MPKCPKRKTFKIIYNLNSQSPELEWDLNYFNPAGTAVRLYGWWNYLGCDILKTYSYPWLLYSRKPCGQCKRKRSSKRYLGSCKANVPSIHAIVSRNPWDFFTLDAGKLWTGIYKKKIWQGFMFGSHFWWHISEGGINIGNIACLLYWC